MSDTAHPERRPPHADAPDASPADQRSGQAAGDDAAGAAGAHTPDVAPPGTGAPDAGDAAGNAPGAPDASAGQLAAALAEQREKLLRLAAEFDNFRKRALRERENAAHHGQGVVIRGLLDALDDLSRFAHVDAWTTEVETMIDGARMVEQKILKSLAGHGLEVVNPLDAAFDPALHEAVSTTSAESPDADHTVSQVYQVGYVFNGQLLRPARVVVRQWSGART